MKYSIIIACYDGIELTSKCIQSVLSSTKDFELIVVDNGSNDGTQGYLFELRAHNTNVKVIRNGTNQTFAAANNQAIKISEGEYICFLNNDTIVDEGWLDRMREHFDNIPLKNVGIIGPVSSMSNGPQMVGQQEPQEWYRKNRGKWIMVGVLYGWCLLVKREVLDKIGGFDERFTNSFEDNDLCLRAQMAGYKLAIAYDTYIHHLGQGTLRKIMSSTKEYLRNGMINRERYCDKYYSPEKKKLVAIYRTNGGEHLEESLRQTSKFSDAILVHFCRARENVEEERYNAILKEFPKITWVEFYDGAFQEDYERGRLLEIALQMHAEGRADWCISIDDDEIYEDAFVERVQRMINARNPEIFAYWCQWRTIWSVQAGKEYFRKDSTFGKFSNYRLFKLMQGQEIFSNHPEGHHCGSAPLIAEQNIRWSKMRVKHLGYDTPEQRHKKFEFYDTNDHFKDSRDIGNKDYSHLIDVNVQLEQYREKNGISLVMMVKNEEKLILACLENVEQLIDEMIIVDTGSTDKTKEIIEEFAKYAAFPVKILDYPWEDNYSTPRNFGIEYATKEWILVMDADERFDFGDMGELHRLTEMDAEGIIFHVFNYIEEQKETGKMPKYLSSENLRLFRNTEEFYYTGLIHETLDDACEALRRRREVKIFRCNVPLHHHGYLKNKERVKEKLEYYEKMNEKQIEMTEGKDPRPYFNLAMHYLNEDKKIEAVNVLQTALRIDPAFWHANQQMAAMNINSAKAFLKKAISTMPPSHPFKKQAEEILVYLEERTFGHVKVGV